MAYVWNWLGLTNLLASVLLLVLGLLFLRAKRTEFTVVFAVYHVLAAAQKFSGGMCGYFSADEAAHVEAQVVRA